MAYTTRKTLLQGVLNGDESSWEQFLEFYKPLIRLCGHDFNLTEEEIQDLPQEVLIEVHNANAIGAHPNTVLLHVLYIIIYNLYIILLKYYKQAKNDFSACIFDISDYIRFL